MRSIEARSHRSTVSAKKVVYYTGDMTRFDQIRDWLADWIRPNVEPTTQSSMTPGVDRDVHTLDHWRNTFADLPRSIECPEMQLLVRDSEPPVFTGPGRIKIKSESDIHFYIHGKAADHRRAMEAMRTARENPYDQHLQFRLFATDYRNTKWACGYTNVDFHADNNRDWPLSGKLEQLTTCATGPWISPSSSVEMLIIPPISLDMSEHLTEVARIGTETVFMRQGPGRHTLKILGSQIRFSYEPSGEALWITAETSEALQHPFLEGWLIEPLRIMLGGPVMPCMIARNRGDGTAQVTLLTARPFTEPTAVGLHPPFVLRENRFESFWQLYTDILTLIVREKVDGINPLTAYFDEIAQAARGSRWVLTMTLANSVEALAKGLMTEQDKHSEFSEDKLNSFKKHILEWKEDRDLLERMLNNFGVLKKRSILRFLRDLAAQGSVEVSHVNAWSSIRNAVMHGSLVSPWSTEKDEDNLNAMLKLVHTLAYLRIKRE